MSCTFSWVKATTCDPQTLKQQVAELKWEVSLILKRTMLPLPLTSADIISRRFVNDQARQYVFLLNMLNEPVHEISNNVVCATSKTSDQPEHTRSLIRAFTSHLSILWLLGNWLNTIWRMQRLVRVYTCKNDTLSEITCPQAWPNLMWIQTFWKSDMGRDRGGNICFLDEKLVRPPTPGWNCLDPRTHVWR